MLHIEAFSYGMVNKNYSQQLPLLKILLFMMQEAVVIVLYLWFF